MLDRGFFDETSKPGSSNIRRAPEREHCLTWHEFQKPISSQDFFERRRNVIPPQETERINTPISTTYREQRISWILQFPGERYEFVPRGTGGKCDEESLFTSSEELLNV